jgi:hypothetical protein
LHCAEITTTTKLLIATQTILNALEMKQKTPESHVMNDNELKMFVFDRLKIALVVLIYILRQLT